MTVLTCKCNGHASMHQISALINLSLRVSLVIHSRCKSIACYSEAQREGNIPYTNAAAAQGISGRKQVLGARFFRVWSL